MNSIKDQVMDIIHEAQINHGLKISSCRVPNTYHHDYLRDKIPNQTLLSRADIAVLNSSEDELYSGMLLYLITWYPFEMTCAGINSELVKQCRDITQQEINRINLFMDIQEEYN